MPALSPCSRREFVRRLSKLGYDGPFAGGKHAYMTKHGAAKVRVPNPHQGDISVELIRRILKNAQIDVTDFINA
jgi:predicted RNA binding protein YcfA (HicA-like mRNA interferase family)